MGMTADGNRRKKKATYYNLLIVPKEEGGKTRSFDVSLLRLWLLGGLTVFGIVAVVLLAYVYTPLAFYLPIPNPKLEKKYGQQIAETQRHLNQLAEDVLLLRDYNLQLRKALGEQPVEDSTTAVSFKSAFSAIQQNASEALDSGIGEKSVSSGNRVAENYGGQDFVGAPYNKVVTGERGFRAGFPLVSPTQGFVSQGFEPSRKHFGMDYAAKKGTAVYAATDGYIVFAGWTYDDGNMLMISHGGGYLTVYKHNQSLLKTSRAFVKRGEPIALVGSSGKTSRGPHLHFEVWKDGMPQDPNDFLLTSPETHQIYNKEKRG
jgi:murein DD-endopeptidase MepM/ murein hydrolase activator NlpD